MNARERAAAYLNARPKTKYQVIKYLREKGYEEDEIQDAVKVLEEYHYIDDLQFSRLFFELGFDKGRGIGRISRELKEKGVSEDVIQEAYESLDFVPDQREVALEIAKKTISEYDLESADYKEKQKLMAKVVRKLAGRGFSADISYSVAKEVVRG